MRLIFRVDSSSKIGIGHLARCLKLANIFNYTDIHFVCKNLDGNANFLIKENYKLHLIKSNNELRDAFEFIKILKKEISVDQNKDYIILDNYELKQKWEKKIKPYSKKLLTIDDRFRSSNADFFLNTNWFFEKNENFLKYRLSNLLLGPLYGLINKKVKKKNKRFITIYFGSNDEYNLTSQTLKHLIRLKIKNIIIILGHNFNFIQEIRKLIKGKEHIKIIHKFKNLSAIFSKTRFFIGAGGSTSTERFLYQIPSLICPVAENQQLISRFLHDKNFQQNLDKNFFFNFNKWKKAFLNLKKKEKILIKNLSYLSFEDSTKRIKNIFNNKGSNFKLIKFNEKFKKIMFNFVNQPDAIKSRFNQKYIQLNEHEKFITKLKNNSNEILYLGMFNNVISGFIRFSKKNKKDMYIDIYCCPTIRGNFFAKKMLFGGIKDILRTNKKITFIANVKKNNFKSINFFKKYFRKKGNINNISTFEY